MSISQQQGSCTKQEDLEDLADHLTKAPSGPQQIQEDEGIEDTMSSATFSLPDLSQDQQDIFQRAFTEDSDFLQTAGRISPAFCTKYIRLCKTARLSTLTDEEAQMLLQLTDPPEIQANILKIVKDKGTRAILAFYLLLHMDNETTYGELPSSQEKDEKLELLGNLSDTFITKLKKNVIEISQSFMVPATQGVAKPSPSVATVKPIMSKNKKAEEKMQDEADSEKEIPKKDKEEMQQITERNKGKEKGMKEEEKNYDKVDGPRPKNNRRSWGIRKDDEFFHFIIVCFAVGAALISSYNYADWTISAGIGLISFASLETIGIYFGLVYRIRTVVEAFLPLLRKAPFSGFLKQQ
ncbi:transmembrane protein 40 [Discoglossus pictus]